jgi:putative hydrolase
MPLQDRIDLHNHTSFSDGVCSVEDVVNLARAKKKDIVAITDHYSEFQDLPKRMSKGHLKVYLDTLNRFDVISGVEADILPDDVSISKHTTSLLDLVLGGLHSLNDRIFWGDARPIWKPESFVEDIRVTLIRAIESELLDVLVHPTWLPDAIRPQTNLLITKNWIDSVIDTAADYNVAIEISGAWKVPDELFVKECLKKGVKLSIGSDGHNASSICNTKYATDLLKKVKASPESIFLPHRF